MVARLVCPRIANPDSCIRYARLVRLGCYLGIERLARFHTCRGFLARQQNGDTDPCFIGRFAQSLLDALDQVRHSPTFGIHGILVRSHAVASNQIRLAGQLLTRVTMQVHTSRNDRLIANHRTYPVDEVSLGIVQSLHTHRPMNIQEQRIVGGVLFQQLKRLLGQRLVGLSRHDTTRSGAADHRWEPLCLLTQSRVGR